MNKFKFSHSELKYLNKLHPLRNLDMKKELPEIAKLLVWTNLEKNSILMKQKDFNHSLHILLKGEVKIAIDGIPIDSIQLKSGGILGEVEFFHSTPCSATVLASQPSLIISIPYPSLKRVIKNRPEIGSKIYHSIVLESLKKLKSITKQLLELTLGNPSFQFAHDIQSPLAALKILSENLESIGPKQDELLTLIIHRIDRMATTLLSQNPSKLRTLKKRKLQNLPTQISCQELVNVISQLQNEKKLQYHVTHTLNFQWLPIPRALKNLKIAIHLIEFERVLANLIDNSVQSLKKKGFIQIGFKKESCFLRISIRDNGCGVPASLLGKLGKKRIKSKKVNGNGLGLLHAHQQVHSWGGLIHIRSFPKIGTEVLIKIPLSDNYSNETSQ